MAKCIELIMILNLTIPLHDLAKLCFLIQSKKIKSSEYHQEFNSTGYYLQIRHWGIAD